MTRCDEFLAVTATGDLVSRCLCGRCDWVLAALKRMGARHQAKLATGRAT